MERFDEKYVKALPHHWDDNVTTMFLAKYDTRLGLNIPHLG